MTKFLKTAIKEAEMRRIDPSRIRVIITVRPKYQEHVESALRRIGARILGSIPGFIRAEVRDAAMLETIEKLEGVTSIAYDAPVWPMAYGVDELFKRIAIKLDPLLGKLHQSQIERLGIRYKPAVILPSLPEFVATKVAQAVFPFAPPVYVRNIKWKLVTETRNIIEAPTDNKIRRTKVAVIDTGANPHPALRKIFKQYVLVPEPPLDSMGHGMWCSTCAFGDPVPTRYGNFVPIASAPGKLFMHIKIFTAFGPTSTWHVMKAMELAARKGARVVSMSLGGPLQDDITKDPSCVLLDALSDAYKTIFVVAAGNEGDEWTISSPGAAPKAVTVAAIDWATLDTASYSSRGPQGEFYRDNRDLFEDRLREYGDTFLKPDIAAPGGDTKTQIVSGVTGWYDSIYDLVPDGFEAMTGTSMACPHAAGLIALLVDRGVVSTADDVKNVMRRLGEKKIDKGWGIIKKSYFRGV